MATRDIRQLVEEVRAGNDVAVREDGTIERKAEAQQNAAQEEAQNGAPAPRQRVKHTTFGSGRSPARPHERGEAGGASPRFACAQDSGSPGFWDRHDEDRVSESVLRRFPELAAEFPGVETGGITLGPDPYSITELIPSGPSAERQADSFSLDPDFLNPVLDEARKRGLQWTGVWHVHPRDYPEPSTTDERAARDLLNDPETGLGNRLLLPISTRTATGLMTRFFVAEKHNGRIRRICPAITSDADDLETEVVTRGPREAAATLRALYAAHRDARLKEETRTLRTAGFEVSERRGKRGAVGLRAARKGVALWFLVPLEFPASPPEVFAEEGTSLREVQKRDLPTLTGWSSSRNLLTLAWQAEASVQSDREAEALTLRPRAIELIRRAWPGSRTFH